MAKVKYSVLQDYKREVFVSESWDECIKYIKEARDEIDNAYAEYICRFNEKDGTLIVQSIDTGEFVTTLNTRMYDPKKGSAFGGFDILTKILEFSS